MNVIFPRIGLKKIFEESVNVKRVEMSKKSFVWEHFIKDGSVARCNVGNCRKTFVAGKGTSNLSKHLKTFHSIIDKELEVAQTHEKEANDDSSGISSRKRQRTIENFLKFRSFPETVARLAAQDNLTFKQITESSFIRKSLASDFPLETVPKNQSAMADVVEKFFEQSKKGVIQKLEKMKKEGHRFSATLDEWTSIQNKRYININLHYSVSFKCTEYINLGMIKIKGSCPADKMRE